MTNASFVIPLKEGGTSSVWPEIGPVDPNNIRAKLMLETTSHMMTEFDWPYRETTIELKSQGDEIGMFRLYGANSPDAIRKVFERKIDISILNPGAILAMAHRGIGLFSEPMQVALIAVMPHHDQLGLAVAGDSGLSSLVDIREKRFPLRVSVRGSLDACTHRLVEKVLRMHGFGYDDIVSWGGFVSYDQPMPIQPVLNGNSRIERMTGGELDAVFEEGVPLWTNAAVEAGMRVVDIDEDHLVALEHEGFRRATIEKSVFEKLPKDVATVDFSGWPIFTRVDTSDLLIRKFCEAMVARKDAIPWAGAANEQKGIPVEKMVTEAVGVPIDLPFHRAAREFWLEKGYL